MWDRRSWLRANRRRGWWVGVYLTVVFTGLAVFLVLVGLQHRTRVEPVKGGVTTTGVVIGRRDVGSRSTAWEPVIEFVDQHGVIHQFNGVSGDTKPTIGSPVRVSYDPREPTIAHDLSQGARVWAQVYLGVGLLALELVCGGVALWLSRRGPRSRHAA